jgi:hypothetical protein
MPTDFCHPIPKPLPFPYSLPTTKTKMPGITEEPGFFPPKIISYFLRMNPAIANGMV